MLSNELQSYGIVPQNHQRQSQEPSDHEIPDVVLSQVQTRRASITVVREDLLPGGTKQRACVPYLKDEMSKGQKKFVYASPFAGFAQVALAYSASLLGCKVRLFCEKDPNVKGREFHAFSQLARTFGADLVMCDNLADAESASSSYVDFNKEFKKIPLGFDCDCFRDHLKEALKIQWRNIKATQNPKRVWVALGSGTLSKTLREVLPADIELHAVDVHVLKSDDARVQTVRRLPNTFVNSAPELFSEEAFMPPPQLPSNIHYDSKVWQFIRESAQDGDLWWNVAR